MIPPFTALTFLRISEIGWAGSSASSDRLNKSRIYVSHRRVDLTHTVVIQLPSNTALRKSDSSALPEPPVLLPHEG